MGMLKKYVPGFIVSIPVYIGLRFAAKLLEDWVMGEVLEQMENNGLSLFILWVLPLLGTIGLIAIGIYLWQLFRAMQRKAAGEYQPQKSRANVVVLEDPSVGTIVGRGGGLEYELNTHNKKGFLLEAKVPIQSARFTKPKEIIVRPDYLPIIVECENSLWKRMRNKILFVPSPRIVVNSFTEKGITWDEQNTDGAEVAIEFYHRQL